MLRLRMRTDYRITGDIVAQTKEQKAAYNKAWRQKHPEQMKALRDRWFTENRQHRKTYMKGYKLRTYSKRYHGVDREAYEAMCVAQEHLCLICQEKRPLVVDHCHDTNVVRGLLCRSCNTAIGLLRDNCVLIARVIAYLQRPLA